MIIGTEDLHIAYFFVWTLIWLLKLELLAILFSLKRLVLTSFSKEARKRNEKTNTSNRNDVNPLSTGAGTVHDRPVDASCDDQSEQEPGQEEEKSLVFQSRRRCRLNGQCFSSLFNRGGGTIRSSASRSLVRVKKTKKR